MEKINLKEGDLVCLHLGKERFLKQRKSKPSLRRDGPFHVQKNNAYRLDFVEEYGVHTSFNISNLTSFVGEDEENEPLDLRTNPSPRGGR